MKTKRVLALVLLCCLCLCLAACGPKAGVASPGDISPSVAPATATPAAAPTDSVPEEPSATRLFTDSTGRVVEIPGVITKIAVSGPLSQIVLFALAPDMLVGIANEWDPGAADYFDPKYFGLPLLGQLYGGKGEMNLEELLAADPDLVLDVGEPKGSIKEDMDALSQQTGIPFLHIDAYTSTMGATFRTLGQLLGLEETAAVLADYCDEIYRMAQDLVETVGEENKVKTLYLLGEAGLNVIARGSYHAEIIDMMTNNLAVLDNPSSKGTGNETDMEQLLLWDPEFILFSYDSAADSVASDPTWRQLSAIQNGRYAKAPYGPYNWMGFPPSVQRYLGILWLAKTLYPSLADYDLYTEVNRYFQLFYHCTLTEERYQAIVG